MKTAFTLSIAVALFLSANAFSSSVGQLHTTAQQESQKQKPDSESKVSGELGSKTNPVRCKGPQGERAYLNRLRCTDEKAPEYHRIGSFEAGPYGNILDGYNVKCEDKDPVTIFMDMYHNHIEKEPVPGFTIVD